MPRRHLRTYRRPKPADEAIADLERTLSTELQVPSDTGHFQNRPLIDYRPIVAVIGLVVFGLGLIAFLLTMRG
jgi:hypothetical protein